MNLKFTKKVLLVTGFLFLNVVLSTFNANAQCSSINFNVSPDPNPLNRCVPQANFIFTPSGIPTGSTVTWDYGDGNTSNIPSVNNHLYAVAGPYVCTLSVTLPGGVVCTPITQNVVVDSLPDPTFTTDTIFSSCTGSLTKTFTLVNTNFVGSAVWQFKNLSTGAFVGQGTGGTASMSVTQTGNYEIVVGVFRNGGLSGCNQFLRDTISIVIRNPILGSVAINGTTRSCLPLSRTYTPTVNLNGNTLDSLVWNAQGSSLGTLNTLSTAAQNLTYTTQGKFDVSVKAYSGGCEYVLYDGPQSVYVEQRPVTQFSLPGNANNVTLCIGDTLTILNTTPNMLSYDSTRWVWQTLGANSVQTRYNQIRRVYTQPGTYNVRLAYGSNPPNSNVACPDDTIRTAIITVNGPVAVINPGMVRVNCTAPWTASFSHNSILPPTGTNSYKWVFFYSDGRTRRDSLFTQTPSLTYDSLGTYRVMLSVTNSSTGCTNTQDAVGWIRVGQPIADLAAAGPAPGCGSVNTPYTVNTTTFNTTTNFGGYTYLWKVIDASNNQVVSTYPTRFPTINITTPGTYHVRLIVSLQNLCSDSITRNNYITVYGITGYTQNSPPTGACPPTTNNYAVSGVTTLPTNTAITYQWNTTPNTNVSIASPTASSTNITFNDGASYSISCLMVTTEGCSTQVDYNSQLVGTTALFSINPAFCINTPTATSNASTGNLSFGSSFVWSVIGAPGAVFSPNNVDYAPTISIPTVGNYTVRLIITNDVGCKDTSEVPISTYTMNAQFSASQTNLACAPAAVQFVSSTANAASWQWFVIDSIVGPLGNLIPDTVFFAGTDTAFFIFTTNGYKTVGLIATSADGCVDTLIRDSLINIDGPVLRYNVTNKRGCSPIITRFVDVSRNLSGAPIVDWGNGQFKPYSVRGVTTMQYFYPYTTATTDSFQFYFSLTATGGSAGCQFVKRDTITVFPQPYFLIKADTVGCAPFTVNFRDSSRFISNISWDFGDPNTLSDTSNQRSPSYTYNLPGVYTVRMRATSPYGCTKDSTWSYTIRIYQAPTADFSATSINLCNGNPAAFTDQSTPTGQIGTWIWNFGDPLSLADTSRTQSPTYSYTGPGTYDVSLIVRANNGCYDTLTRLAYVNVFDTLPPQNTNFSYVSVNGSSVDMAWPITTIPAIQFGSYELYQANGTNIASINNIAALNFTHANPNALLAAQGYRIKVKDVCGKEAVQFVDHYTVYLDVVSTSLGVNSLSWTPYIGWSSVSNYVIYRADGNNPFVPIDTVAGTVNTYDDQNLCNINYCYYIRAINGTAPNIGSNSNIDCNTPLYQISGAPINLKRTTVVGNTTLTEWDTPPQSRVDYFIVERFNDRLKQWETGFDTTSNNYFYDSKVEVFEKSYTYRVRFRDVCGNLSDSSNIGQSIVLDADTVPSSNGGFDVRLRWNRYNFWSNGVARYEVYYKKDGVPVKLGDVTDTVFIDTDVPKPGTEAYCYYVAAVENSATPDTSNSQVLCYFYPSAVYVPNAFTPNNDNLNQEFVVLAGGLKSYQINIYDRWGRKVFESNTPTVSWNGRLNNAGDVLSAGNYIYMITGRGGDGKRFRQSGTIELIK